jgi:uncharacterized Zn-finger protein
MEKPDQVPPSAVQCQWGACSLSFQSPNELWMHIRQRHTGEPFRPGDPIHACTVPYCVARFSRPSDLRRHMALEHYEKPKQCIKCSFETSVKEQMTKHMVVVHKEGCEHCGIVSKSWRDHMLHQRQHNMHLHPCNIEGCLRTFATLAALNRHVVATHNASFKCSACHQLLSSAGRLQQHMESCIPKLQAHAKRTAARIAELSAKQTQQLAQLGGDTT